MSADSFADDEKRAELNRLFSHWRFKRAPIARPLLRHLADLTLEHPEGQGWKGKDVIESLSDDVTAQGDPAIYFSRLRTLLVRHYTAERKLGRKAEGEICVTVPMVEDTRKGYHVDFEPFPGPYETDPVLGFWRQVGYGFPAAQRRLQPSPINILFSNERPERGQHELDERGAASGSGEVVAAYELGRCLAQAGLEAEMWRSRAVKTNLLMRTQSVLIFVGSSLAMSPLRVLEGETSWNENSRFVLTWKESADTSARPDGAIKDRVTSETFVCSGPRDGRSEIQYALIRVLRTGLNQRVITFEGLSTFGTEAAVRFLTQADSLSQLFERLKAHPRKGGRGRRSQSDLYPFEAVLELTVHWDMPGVATVHRFHAME